MATKVLVLKGGDSSEREISLKSAANTTPSLIDAGFEVKEIDIKDMADSQLKEDCLWADVVFPVLHGVGGEDGAIQAKLESWGVRYIGSDSLSSKICMNKQSTRDIAQKAGIKVALGQVINLDDFKTNELAKKPYVLKPIVGGSSVDTFIVRDVALAPIKDIEKAFSNYETLLIEELIDGIEITVGVIGNTSLPVIEIVPPKDEEFDYVNKYNGKTQDICPPINVGKDVQVKAQNIAYMAHTIFGCRDISRSDFMLNSKNEIFFLETNTIPGLTKASLLPVAAAAANIDMPQLVSKLVSFALSR